MFRRKKTYKEWQSKGFQVMKGEKAVAFDKEGKGLFLRKQVKPAVRQVLIYEHIDDPWDYLDDRGLLDEEPF